MANKYPVVVIGAGFCGLTSLKTCLESGLEAICFEKSHEHGGLWRFREADEHGMASVQRSTVINTSKEASAFSDFPPDPKYANFMANTNLLEYLTSYMRHFNLEPHIRYGHEVTKVEKAPDYDDTGNWVVHVVNEAGEESKVTASGVLVAIGHHVYPNQPSFPGLTEFRGKVLHSHSYKDYSGMEKKRVLVIGVGNSAMDIAVELSNVNSKVFLSTRRGAWIIGRMGPHGIPFDYTLNRFATLLYYYFPRLYTWLGEKMLNYNFDHETYNLKPSHSIMAQHPTICDAMPSRIISGVVVVKGDISRFTPTGVVFKGEEDVEVPIDVVVTATGYDILMPLLEGIIPVKRNQVDLYARVFPPELKHPTLAVIGLIQPLGCIFPIAELQARWTCGIIKRQLSLPPVAERWEEIHTYKKSLQERYVASPRHTIQVDYLPYVDFLAEAVGCKPNMAKIFYTDPALFFKLLFGPPVAYQFRLTGPYPWKGAREAIMTAMNRTKAAFNTRHHQRVQSSCHCGHTTALILFSLVIAVLALVYYKFL